MNPTPIDRQLALDASILNSLLHKPGVLPLLARHNFGAFAHMGIHILLGSDAPTKLLWHVEAMSHLVSEIDAGRCRRAIVTVPPRHLKSTVLSVEQIAWRLGQDPTIKIMLVSYSKALSKELLGKVRILMAHPGTTRPSRAWQKRYGLIARICCRRLGVVKSPPPPSQPALQAWGRI